MFEISKNDFTWFRGDDLPIKLEFTETDVDGNVSPVDITGWTIFFTLKRHQVDPDSKAVVIKTITSLDDPTTGVQLIKIPSTETDSLIGPYYYDVQTKTIDGIISTIASGTIVFTRDVTIRTS